MHDHRIEPVRMIGGGGSQRIDYEFQRLNPGKVGLQRFGRLAALYGAGTGEEPPVATDDKIDFAWTAVLQPDFCPKLDPATGEVQFPHRISVSADPGFGGFTRD